jgi:hypothetical protein
MFGAFWDRIAAGSEMSTSNLASKELSEEKERPREVCSSA